MEKIKKIFLNEENTFGMQDNLIDILMDIIFELNEIADRLNQSVSKPVDNIFNDNTRLVCKYCGGSNVVGNGMMHYYYCIDCDRPTDLIEIRDFNKNETLINNNIGKLEKVDTDVATNDLNMTYEWAKDKEKELNEGFEDTPERLTDKIEPVDNGVDKHIPEQITTGSEKKENCYAIDMIQEYMKKCADGWHEWGYHTRDGGHGERAVGEQVCIHCGIAYSVFLNSIKQPLKCIPEETPVEHISERNVSDGKETLTNGEETKEDWRGKPSEDRLKETELLLKIHGIEKWNKNQIDIVARIIMLAEYNAKHPKQQEETKSQSGEREESVKERFFERVNDVRREILDAEGDSIIHEFGYKTRRGNEMFIVTDFERIFKWIEKELLESKKECMAEERAKRLSELNSLYEHSTEFVDTEEKTYKLIMSLRSDLRNKIECLKKLV